MNSESIMDCEILVVHAKDWRVYLSEILQNIVNGSGHLESQTEVVAL